jgi:hypothetical protein
MMQGAYEARVVEKFQSPELKDLKLPGIIIPSHVIENEGCHAFFQRHGGDSVTDLLAAWRDKATRQPWTKDITAGMFQSLARLHSLVSSLVWASCLPT